MKKLAIGLLMIASFGLGTVAQPWIHSIAVAQPPPKVGEQITVPRVWGKVVGVMPGGVVFEGSDGSLRFFGVRGGLELTIMRN